MQKLIAALVIIPALLAPAEINAGSSANARATDFAFEAIDGRPMPLANFKGKVLLVVNTASFCGFTKQYEGLQTLYQRYEAKGLVVIGVPSNDFGEQEPKTGGEIADFCKGAFGVTFPLTTKQVVRGAGAHPFYAWADATLGSANAPRWNFHKYIVSADGQLVSSFSTQTEPMSPKVITAIEAELAKTAQ